MTISGFRLLRFIFGIVLFLAFTPLLLNAESRVPQLSIKVVASAETVRDWENDRCDDTDTPDTPPRAYRDALGKVHFFSTESDFREYSGPSLDDLKYNCRIIFKSAHNDQFERFEDRQWFAATYTMNGKTIYALIHNEYHGHLRPAICPSRSYAKCWGNVLTFAISRDGGKSFEEPAPPGNLVAMPPYRYEGDFGKPTGYFQPSNIVSLNGYFYTLFKATRFHDQMGGVCLMRTSHLDNPKSWRGWNGSSFSVQFENPYVIKVSDPSSHVCAPLKAKLLTMGGMARDEFLWSVCSSDAGDANPIFRN